MKKNLINSLGKFINKSKPEILMSLGIGGMIFSIISAIKVSEKVSRALEDKKIEEHKDKLTFIECVKVTWKLYLPTAISTAISIPCIICGNRVSSRRAAALATAYTLSETALQEYQAKTKEIIGAKKEQDIHEAVTAKEIERTYPPSQIIMTRDGEDLFYEPLSGRYFKSNWNKVLKAANELNQDALRDISPEILLNDWFYAIGLPDTELGELLEWNTDTGLIDISVDAHMTNDQIPCGAIHYNTRPIYK